MDWEVGWKVAELPGSEGCDQRHKVWLEASYGGVPQGHIVCLSELKAGTGLQLKQHWGVLPSGVLFIKKKV